MKIAASIYSSREDQREGLIEMLDEHNIDYFHVDCNDNPAVFDDIRQIREKSNTPIDLHIISPQPEKYFNLIREFGVESVTIQYEACQNGFEIPELS